MAEKQTKIIET